MKYLKFVTIKLIIAGIAFACLAGFGVLSADGAKIWGVTAIVVVFSEPVILYIEKRRHARTAARSNLRL